MIMTNVRNMTIHMEYERAVYILLKLQYYRFQSTYTEVR